MNICDCYNEKSIVCKECNYPKQRNCYEKYYLNSHYKIIKQALKEEATVEIETFDGIKGTVYIVGFDEDKGQIYLRLLNDKTPMRITGFDNIKRLNFKVVDNKPDYKKILEIKRKENKTFAEEKFLDYRKRLGTISEILVSHSKREIETDYALKQIAKALDVNTL